MAAKILIAFCTFPEGEAARTVAKQMVEQKLAACANILPQIRSIYRWQGKIESGDETLVIFKLADGKYSEFEKALRKLHPYDVPEIISWNIEKGLPEYLEWVNESCAS